MNRINSDIEDKIVYHALKKLGRYVTIGDEIRIESLRPSNKFPQRPNRLLKMTINNQPYEFCIDIKTVVTRTHLMMLQLVKDGLEYPPLVIGQYVNPQIADTLKDLGICFIDTAGNAFINRSPLYIFIRGNKATEIKQAQPAIRTFKATGLKIIYALICHPGLEKRTYREIAAVSDVALGTVNWIMGELKELGYLSHNPYSGQQLVQKSILLQRWAMLYPDQLRPKQILGRYRTAPDWWQKTNLYPVEAQWAGEAAAARLGVDLEPQHTIVYVTTEGMSRLLTDHGLSADEDGNVEFVRRFWGNGPIWLKEDTVPPLLIYADLLATGTRTSMEAAKRIYEENLAPLIGDE